MVGGGSFFGDLQWKLASLLIRIGGLGLYSSVEISSYIILASRAQYWMLHDHILKGSGLYGMYSNFDRALDGLNVAIPNFDRALDGLSVAIPNFDLSSFTRNDIVLPKVKILFVNFLFSKSV